MQMMTEIATPTPEELLYLAKVYEEAELFEDMIACMKKYASFKPDLSTEARTLLWVAYKNHCGSRRAAFRSLEAIEQNAEGKIPQNAALIKEYKEIIKEEIITICQDALNVVDSVLKTSNTISEENQVFFLKVKGDYNRYTAEYGDGERRSKACEEAFESYQKASEIAKNVLHIVNPLRLGVALNYSVFLADVMNEKHNACKMTRDTLDAVMADYENIPDEHYLDSTLIVSLLNDNRVLWLSEIQGEEI